MIGQAISHCRIAELVARGVLRESGRSFDIGDKSRLQDELLRGYEFALRPKLLLGRFRSSDKDLDDMLASVRKRFADLSIRWSVTGWPAAHALQKFYRGLELPIFVDSFPDQLRHQLQIIPDKAGPLIFLRSFGTVPFCWETKPFPLAHPWLIYAELIYSSDPRAHGAAEEIKREFLSWEMPDLTDNQIADLQVPQKHSGALGAELVVIGAIAYQVHFPAESRHTGDIDFAVALDFDEFAELERRFLADGWVRFANREHQGGARRERSCTWSQLDPSFGKPSRLRGPLVSSWWVWRDSTTYSQPLSPIQLAPDLTLKVISSTPLMLLKIVAFMDAPQRRVKDMDDVRGLLVQYEVDSERIFPDVVIDAALQDFGLAPAFLAGLDLRALCADAEAQVVYVFLDAMNETNPA